MQCEIFSNHLELKIKDLSIIERNVWIKKYVLGPKTFKSPIESSHSIIAFINYSFVIIILRKCYIKIM